MTFSTKASNNSFETCPIVVAAVVAVVADAAVVVGTGTGTLELS